MHKKIYQACVYNLHTFIDSIIIKYMSKSTGDKNQVLKIYCESDVKKLKKA